MRIANQDLKLIMRFTSLLAVARDRVFLLSRPKASASVFGGLSFRQQSLDVVQLHKCLLEGVLGISEQAIRDLAVEVGTEYPEVQAADDEAAHAGGVEHVAPDHAVAVAGGSADVFFRIVADRF